MTPSDAKFVRVVGMPGSGKSYLAAALARDLGVPHLDIAAQPGHLSRPLDAWDSLRRHMRESAVIESAGTSSFEGRFWRRLPTMVVVCYAPLPTRTARLSSRPEARSEHKYVERMLRIPAPHVTGHVWSGIDPIPGDAYDALLGEVRSFIQPPALMPFVA